VIRIFNYYRLVDFFDAVAKRKTITFTELAQKMDVTVPSVTAAFHGEERLVINRVKGWKRAFGFKRIEGDYFELLAILAGYPSSARQEELRRRAFHLVQKFFERKLFNELSYEIFYWLSPECAILRNLIDLHDCPEKPDEIVKWAVTRVEGYRKLKKLSRTKMEIRFDEAWNTMMEIRAVKWDKADKRWTKVTPSRSTIIQLKANPEDLRASLLILPHADIFADFARQQGTDFMQTSMVSTLSMPKKLEELLERYLRKHVVELVNNLVISCSPADLAELKKMDKDVWKEAKEFREQFAADLGMYAEDLPTIQSEDYDSVAQIVLGIRRLTS
jgi:hypothetical protein